MELVRLALAGEREAFAGIYRRYHRVVFRFARVMSGSIEVAEDVTQEVFVLLMRDLGRYESRRAGLSSYLYGMARNVTRGRLRRERRFANLHAVEAMAADSSADPAAAYSEAQNVARLRLAIAALPSRFREVIILCDLHGLSYAEAAAALGMPVGTVRSRLHRARRRVAQRLRPPGAGAEPAPANPATRCLA